MLSKKLEEIRNQGKWKGYCLVREIYQYMAHFYYLLWYLLLW